MIGGTERERERVYSTWIWLLLLYVGGGGGEEEENKKAWTTLGSTRELTRVTFVHIYAVSPWPRVIKSRNRNAHRWMMEVAFRGVGRMEWKFFDGSKHTAMELLLVYEYYSTYYLSSLAGYCNCCMGKWARDNSYEWEEEVEGTQEFHSRPRVIALKKRSCQQFPVSWFLKFLPQRKGRETLPIQ